MFVVGPAVALMRTRCCGSPFYTRFFFVRLTALTLSCAARAHVPKPERRGGCRERRSENRVANCNRRDAVALTTRQAARLPGRSRAAPASA